MIEVENMNATGHHVVVAVKTDLFSMQMDDPERDKLYAKVNGAFYFAEILSVGARATEPNWCPELTDTSKYVMISDVAGVTPPTGDTYTKVVLANNIVALTAKYKDMTIEDMKATGERVLVELIKEETEVNGIVVSDAKDPRDGSVQAGIIRDISQGAKVFAPELEVGMTVHFEPEYGNLLIQSDDIQIKTLNVNDIKYHVQ